MYKTREAGIILKQSLEKNEQAICKKCTVIRMRMKTKWYHMSFSHGNYMNCTKCLCKFFSEMRQKNGNPIKQIWWFTMQI